MKVKSLNSIVFHCQDVAKAREFYVDVLGLEVGKYEKDGETVPDESESYVNFHLDNSLLCFEKGQSNDKGTIILNVDDLGEFKNRLIDKGLKIEKESENWLIFKDPDGRSLILEPCEGK